MFDILYTPVYSIFKFKHALAISHFEKCGNNFLFALHLLYDNSFTSLIYNAMMYGTLCFSRRYHLKGPKKGQVDTFVENLPGVPDNIRPSSGGGYWLCDAVPRGPGFSLFDFLAPRPLIRRLLTQVHRMT